MRSSWTWTGVLLLAALFALLVTFAFPGSLLRPYVLFGFLLFCPGMALVRVLGFSVQPMIAITLATSLSIALDAIIAAVFLYVHAWSPDGIFIAIILWTLVCGLLHLLLTVFRERIVRLLAPLHGVWPSRLALHKK